MAKALVVSTTSGRPASADRLAAQFWVRASIDYRAADLPLLSERDRRLADSVQNATDPASGSRDVYSLRPGPIRSLGLGQY